MTKITSILKLQTLLTLSNGTIHGYDMMKRLRHLRTTISPSQVYPFLKELEHKKYVVVHKGKRNKKEYTLTTKGKQFLHTLTTTYASILDSYIKERVKQCSHCKCEIYKGGYTKNKKTYCCEHCANFSPKTI